MSTPIEESFRLRTLRDVLDARDAYHFYLVNQPHVLATAVGLYLVRDEEADTPTTPQERLALPPGTRPPRTLGNSRVQPWSWPCVLVFVDDWLDDAAIARNPDAMVPRRLYLRDGRVVPTCVVYAPPSERPPALEQHLNLPSLPLGGGYVCLSTVQGREHVGSIGCLVTDGDKTYALTNRHVAGPAGRVLRSIVAGGDTRIGCSASISVSRRLLTELYPGFAGERVEVAIDAGLIDVDDVDDWTTQVFGIGQLDEMLDVSADSLTLAIIGTPVRAFGAASGPLAGEILGLFYRYRTVGGTEYVADALVAPRGEELLATQPGDSGTLWVLDPEDGAGDPKVVEAGKPAPKATPVAVQWGGHVFVRGASQAVSPYALATFLSNVCRTLDVELVRDWNLGHDQYWGPVGHYTIGAKACELPDTPELRDFFLANQLNISFDLSTIVEQGDQVDDASPFFPLADVPDNFWKGHGPGSRPHEGPNHFADMDQPDSSDGGQTLLSLFRADPASLDPQRWIDFYQHVHTTPSHMGLLPFRVAQLYRAIVESLQANTDDSVARALCAAGVMAHYVGDACQPLHTSMFFDGRGEADKGVHSAYETTMVGSKRDKIVTGLGERLRNAPPLQRVEGHRAAGAAVVALMDRSVTRLPPLEICDAYAADHHTQALWDVFGERTIDCIADGCQTLAMLWSSAWAEAGGAAPPAVAIPQPALSILYSEATFVPSLYLPDYAAAGIW